MLQLHVSRNLPAAMGVLILLTALLCMQICTAQQMPSYFQKFAVAKASSSNAETSIVVEKFLEEFSILLSPARFQEELLDGIDSFLSGNNTAGIANVSELCFNQTGRVLVGLAGGESWALTFLDTIGKPPPNLKGLNFVWPGAYKECFSLTVNDSNSLMQAEFKGQYCTASLTLSEVIPFAVVNEGLCVPSSCSSEDVTLFLQVLARRWNKEKQVSATCKKPSKPLNSYAIAGVVVCSLLAALMVIGTLIDIFVIQMPKWRSQEMDSLGINSVFENVAEEEKPLLLGFKTGIATPEPGLIIQILVSFSVYTNGSKLLSTTQSHDNNLACLHGIRFFSMTWVVLGHTFIMPLGAASNFLNYYLEVRNRWSFLAISNAVFSVDTFFVLSGLLVTFLSLKEMKRCAGRLNWAIFYLHRFWRLTPLYMMILLLYVCLGPYWGSGPMWPDKQPDRDNCKMSWWTNLLYINNFVDLDKSCMGFTWYLANDMQFYILSPLIFVPFYYSVKCGVIVYGIFLTATVVTPACLTMADHLPASLLDAGTEGSAEKYQHELYIKPYTRMGPYIVGMITGYLLYHCNCRIQINKILNLCGWMVATAVALAVVYGLYDDFEGHALSLSMSALYNALSRIAWGTCVAWVIFSCVTGNGGFVNTILSWKALVPLSRLTYCVYLVHIIIMEAYFYSRDTPFYISDENVVLAFLGLLLFSFMVAAVMSIACEAPMIALEKIFLKTLKRRE